MQQQEIRSSAVCGKELQKRIDTLIDAPDIEALFLMNSLNHEVLKGDKKGISSIRINRQYRLEFKVSTHAP